MQRREFIRNTGLLAAAAVVPTAARAAESPLIYVSPFKSDGALSSCQAEIWYVQDGADMFVVTASSAWRARAVAQGLVKTRVWVGDVGMWKRSSGRYKELPALVANAVQIDDPIENARVLGKFGTKYSSEWGSWGPRFKKGLADGSRVMLRYRPV